MASNRKPQIIYSEEELSWICKTVKISPQSYFDKFRPNSQNNQEEHQRYSHLLRKADISQDYRERLRHEFDNWKVCEASQFWADRSIQNSAIRTSVKLVAGSEPYAKQSLKRNASKIQKNSLLPNVDTENQEIVDQVTGNTQAGLLPHIEKRVHFGQDQQGFDADAPFNLFGPPSTSSSTSESFQPGTNEDSTGEFSVILDRPQRIVRLVGPGQESSALKLAHWLYEKQDISKKLMSNRALLMKDHESLQRVHEILEAMLDITEVEKLAQNTCCQPIRSSAIALAISDISFIAANEGYLTTLNAWKKVQLSWQEDNDHAEQWEVLQAMIDHLLITATLWSPLRYTNKQKGNEDSFSHNIVRPFLTCAFGRLSGLKLRGNGDRFTCGDELDKELKFPDFSVTMDCYNKSLGEHYLVIAEVKSPSASQDELDDDHIKLSNLMKSALDWQISQGYGDGTVVGILVQGWKVFVCHIVLEHEAIYELRNIGQFMLIADHTQMAQLLSICPVLVQAKAMVENTKKILYKRPPSASFYNDKFYRPSYNITPILISPDDCDEKQQESSQDDEKNSVGSDLIGSDSSDLVAHRNEVPQKKGLKRKRMAQLKKSPQKT
ncbi:hypothetical protein BGZ76_010640 [Entomortierella beljakovae]|nr:hypothetical protein BGZ76_010640 [Entomortierella beljakovae]